MVISQKYPSPGLVIEEVLYVESFVLCHPHNFTALKKKINGPLFGKEHARGSLYH